MLKRLFRAYGDVLRASRPLELIFRKIVKIPKLDDLDSFWAKTENGQNRGFVTTRTRRMFALWSWKFICRAYSPSATRCLNQIEKRLISVVFMSLSKSRFWGFKVIAHKNIPNNNRSVWGPRATYRLWECRKPIQKPIFGLSTWVWGFVFKILEKVFLSPGTFAPAGGTSSSKNRVVIPSKNRFFRKKF